jgi:hypothetical protein
MPFVALRSSGIPDADDHLVAIGIVQAESARMAKDVMSREA